MAKPRAPRPASTVATVINDPKNATPFTLAELAATQNEWMRRYIDEPERYEREFKVVQLFRAEESMGKEPTYGDECNAYLQVLRSQLRAEGRL